VSDDNQIKVAVLDNSVYLKPFGYATQANSLGIPDFLDGMFRAGCRFVVFDLAECRGMDSTFLGVIADAATALPHTDDKTAIIINADEDRLTQLRRIGLKSLIKVREQPVPPPENVELTSIDFVHFPKTEMQRLSKIKELHEKLVNLNDKNRRTFGPFIKMLDEEMAEHQQPEKPRQ
jgi:hypothetical protein